MELEQHLLTKWPPALLIQLDEALVEQQQAAYGGPVEDDELSASNNGKKRKNDGSTQDEPVEVRYSSALAQI
jgi:hypothetical protein